MKTLKNTCIIDDDPIFVFGTKRMMKQINFSEDILVYENGQDAILNLKKMVDDGIPLPAVIFLDLNMPIMNGWEFLDDFVKIPNPNREHVVVYIVSSSIDPRDIERVEKYRTVNKYMIKPVTPEDLQKILEEVA